ncbi:MAG: MBL fold metallo-hydrolase [Bacteroidales bacterium]|nr:MBL fold metallo-hydrolase [Bacteroidales bacterium]
MKLTVIGSGSSGNGYILHNDKEALIIEAGMAMRRYKIALGFNVAIVSGCLVTHEHKDHSKYVKDMLASKIPVYMSNGTAQSIFGELEPAHLHRIAANERITVGSFEVLPFKVVHDAKEPFGFLIRHEETGTVLFATDTYYLPCKFNGLNNVMIECNYDANILNTNVKSGEVHPSVAKRVLTSHFSYRHCIEALKANDLSAVNNIVLLHLSSSNSNAEAFRQGVEEATLKATFVAKAGLEIDFGKTPF